MNTPLVIQPLISEKSFIQAEKGVYTFKVPLTANKQTIAKTIAADYKVTVEAVRTVLSKGKAKRIVRKRQQPSVGHRSDFKKAYATLKKGDKIAVFAEGAES